MCTSEVAVEAAPLGIGDSLHEPLGKDVGEIVGVGKNFYDVHLGSHTMMMT